MQVPSRLVVASEFPVGCQAALVNSSAWPINSVREFPVRGFQMMQVLSLPIVAIRSPVGCQAIPVVWSMCPVRMALILLANLLGI